MTLPGNLRVMVLGSGGREHALVQACRQSACVSHLIAAPGNGGMAAEVPCFPVDAENPAAVVALAREQMIDFVIVGPEAPLAVGVVDALEEAGITAYGPHRAAARLEASKVFTKEFLDRHQIPTARAQSFTEVAPALDFVDELGLPVVIKADGLAAGKGVIIAEDREEAAGTLRGMLEEKSFGEAGASVLIEEFLTGPEASIMLVVDGETYVALPPSQDHKRVGEGDTGLNTGGMGAYAPTPVVTPELSKEIADTIIAPTLRGLKADGITYRGTLYIGLMLTPQGPKVLEFNVRFGDPECQVLLPLVVSDIVEMLYTCARGELDPATVKLAADRHAMIVVMAAGGYPGRYEKGKPIQIAEEPDAPWQVVHAGTKLDADGRLVTAGGRVLGVVGFGDTLRAAADHAYAGCKAISWEGAFYRRDIGHRALDPR